MDVDSMLWLWAYLVVLSCSVFTLVLLVLWWTGDCDVLTVDLDTMHPLTATGASFCPPNNLFGLLHLCIVEPDVSFIFYFFPKSNWNVDSSDQKTHVYCPSVNLRSLSFYSILETFRFVFMFLNWIGFKTMQNEVNSNK